MQLRRAHVLLCACCVLRVCCLCWQLAWPGRASLPLRLPLLSIQVEHRIQLHRTFAQHCQQRQAGGAIQGQVSSLVPSRRQELELGLPSHSAACPCHRKTRPATWGAARFGVQVRRWPRCVRLLMHLPSQLILGPRRLPSAPRLACRGDSITSPAFCPLCFSKAPGPCAP